MMNGNPFNGMPQIPPFMNSLYNPYIAMFNSMAYSGMPTIDFNQMKAMLPKLSLAQIDNIKQQARMMGISEQQITQGMNALNSMR